MSWPSDRREQTTLSNSALCLSHPRGPCPTLGLCLGGGGGVLLSLSPAPPVSRSGSGLRKEGPCLACRQVLICEKCRRTAPFQFAEGWVLLVKRSTAITVCWALSVDPICSVHCSLLTQKIHGYFNQKEKFKKKKFSFRHTFPAVLYVGKYQPHGADS